MKKTCLGIILLLSLNQPSWGCGQLRLQAAGIFEDWSRRSDLREQNLQITRTDSSKKCQYTLVFESSHGARRVLRNGATELAYQLYPTSVRSESQALNSHPGNTQFGNTLSGVFQDKSKEDRKLYFFGYTQPEQNFFPLAGMFSDALTVSVFKGSPGKNILPEDRLVLPIRVFVPKLAALSLVSPGSSFNFGDTTESLDFGVLKAGDFRETDLQVMANSGFSISMSSQNGGVLRHSDAGIKSSVSYRLSVGGHEVFLGGARNRPTIVSSSGSTGRARIVRKTVRVTIGDVHQRAAGRYQDVGAILVTGQ